MRKRNRLLHLLFSLYLTFAWVFSPISNPLTSTTTLAPKASITELADKLDETVKGNPTSILDDLARSYPPVLIKKSEILERLPKKMPKSLRDRRLEENEGEKLAKRSIEKYFQGTIKDVFFGFLDINGLGKTNVIYSKEGVDPILFVIEVFISETIKRMKEKYGIDIFYYKAGGDERIIVFETDDDKIANETMKSIDAYIKKFILYQYAVDVVSLNGDSRLNIPEDKENVQFRNLKVREELFFGTYDEDTEEGEKGLLDKIAEVEGVTVVGNRKKGESSGSEQAYVIYKKDPYMEKKVDEKIKELNESFDPMDFEDGIVPFVELKSFAYNNGTVDAVTATQVASSLKDTIADLKKMGVFIQEGAVNLDDLYKECIKRPDIASQIIGQNGKDAAIVLKPTAHVLYRNSLKGKSSKKVLTEELEEKVNKTLLEESFKSDPPFPNLADGLFPKIHTKESFVHTVLSRLPHPGSLINLDIGYMYEKISQWEEGQRQVLKRELIEALKERYADSNIEIDEDTLVTDEALNNAIRAVWKKFRVEQAEVMGVNTKFLNEIGSHGETNSLIKAILTLTWLGFHDLNEKYYRKPKQEGKTPYLYTDILMCRRPPDSLAALVVPNPKLNLKREEFISFIKKEMLGLVLKTNDAWLPVNELGIPIRDKDWNPIDEQGEIIQEKSKISRLVYDYEGKGVFNLLQRELKKGTLEEVSINCFITDMYIGKNELPQVKAKEAGGDVDETGATIRAANNIFKDLDRVGDVLKNKILQLEGNMIRDLKKQLKRNEGELTISEEELNKRVLTAVDATLQGKIEIVDPLHGYVHFESLKGPHLNGGMIFLTFNGNLVFESEKMNVELKILSQTDKLESTIHEKVAKWEAEISRENPSLDELVYILSYLSDREEELTRFNQLAIRLELIEDFNETSMQDLKLAKQVVEKILDNKELPKEEIDAVQRILEQNEAKIKKEKAKKEPFSPSKLYVELQSKIQEISEKIYLLTGFYDHKEWGMYVPKEEYIGQIPKGFQKAMPLPEIKYAYQDFGQQDKFDDTAPIGRSILHDLVKNIKQLKAKIKILDTWISLQRHAPEELKGKMRTYLKEDELPQDLASLSEADLGGILSQWMEKKEFTELKKQYPDWNETRIKNQYERIQKDRKELLKLRLYRNDLFHDGKGAMREWRRKNRKLFNTELDRRYQQFQAKPITLTVLKEQLWKDEQELKQRKEKLKELLAEKRIWLQVTRHRERFDSILKDYRKILKNNKTALQLLEDLRKSKDPDKIILYHKLLKIFSAKENEIELVKSETGEDEDIVYVILYPEKTIAIHSITAERFRSMQQKFGQLFKLSSDRAMGLENQVLLDTAI